VLSRRESAAHGGEYVLDLLQDLTVEDVYEPQVTLRSVLPQTPVSELLRQASETTQAIFPVVENGHELTGIISLDALRAVFVDEEMQRFAIAADCVAPFIAVSPGDSLAVAMERFAASHLPQLPVVNPDNENDILGVLSFEDLLRAYSKEAIRARVRQRGERDSQLPGGPARAESKRGAS
jgi:CIC family chloride channel protein